MVRVDCRASMRRLAYPHAKLVYGYCQRPETAQQLVHVSNYYDNNSEGLASSILTSIRDVPPSKDLEPSVSPMV